jgi:Protein of unknown function (DUF3224)
MTTANATFQVTGWDEKPYAEHGDSGKLTEARVTQQIEGDLEGSSDVRWLMAYSADDRADFVGIQTVTGSLAGKQGSFVLRSAGTFDGKVAEADVTVVEGSGTDQLAGLTGTGRFSSPMGDTATVTLDYSLA